MIDAKKLRRFAAEGRPGSQLLIERPTLIEILDENEKLLKVLKQARESVALEDARLEEGLLRLGQWTPLNCLREVIRSCDDIKTED